jgi:DNA repair protein RadC
VLEDKNKYATGGGIGNEKKKDIISFDYQTRTFQGDKEPLEDIIRKTFNIERRFPPVLNFDKSAMELEFTEYVSEDELKSEQYKTDLFKKVQAVKSKIEGLYNLSVNYYTNDAESWNNFENSLVITIGEKKNYDEGSTFFAKGGLVVTSIKDIPNFKEENEAGRITYRGLGMGKLSDDFYKIAGEDGTRIKVKGKEYYITMSEFRTFSRDSSGMMRIKFDAPFRKFAEGGNFDSEFYKNGGSVYPDLSLQKADVVNDSIQLNEFKIQKTKNLFTINGLEKKKITQSKDVVSILRSLWEKDTINAYEQAYVLYLNNANTVIGYYHHSKGSITGTVMDIQMITGMALKSLAKGVIIAHNHPSENKQPSDADKKITSQLKEGLKVFSIVLLDSVIITDESYFSFADEGLI